MRIHRPEKNEDYSLEIKPNLAAALRELRDEISVRILWIDAICINQSNPEERNQQVPMMADIYGQASRVCVWLGDGKEITGGPKTAMDFIKKEVLNIWEFDRLCANVKNSPKFGSTYWLDAS